MFSHKSSKKDKSSGSSPAPSSGSRIDGHAKSTTKPVTHMPSKLDSSHVSSSSRRSSTHLFSHLDATNSSSASSRHENPTHLPSRLDIPHSGSLPSRHQRSTHLPSQLDAPHSLSRLDTHPAPQTSGYTNPHDIKMASRQTRIESLPPHERQEKDKWAQDKLRSSSALCPQGFLWDRIDGGYICQGGTHRVSDELLAEGKGGIYRVAARPPPGLRHRGNMPIRHIILDRAWEGPIYPHDPRFPQPIYPGSAVMANMMAGAPGGYSGYPGYPRRI